MYHILTSSYIRSFLIACLLFFLCDKIHAQQQQDSITTADLVDSSYVEVEESWMPDTIFNNITGIAYPADSLSTRHIPPGIIDSLKKDEAFWYADLAKNARPKKAIKENQDPGFFNKLVNKQWFQTLVWIIIILGFLSVLVWYLSSSNISLFRPASKFIDHDGDHITTNIFEINYKTEIDKALNSENYRLATRLMFLQLLKRMDEKKLINYQQDLTNLDYRMQLYGTHYAPAFNDLVKFYEFTWYGKWQPGNNQFTQIKNKFESFSGQIN